MKLLCASDLHIGRRPARLPHPWSGGRITAAGAWEELVDRALAEGADAVLLAGDVVDQDNRYFEAYGPLGRGVARLEAAGVAVVAVAGNHDHQALHDVAAAVGLGHLVVLGRGGRWERWTLRDERGVARLHVDGWSFPASRHAADPMADYDLPAPDDEAPVVGLLHCDLDSRDTRYAPVAAAAFAATPAVAWVLGHVHVPALHVVAGRAPLLYPGSLQALGPVETGRRGAWLLELEAGRAPAFKHLPLSRVRYDALDVDVEVASDRDGLRSHVAGALAGRLAEIVDEEVGPLEVVSCVVRLTGRTTLAAEIDTLRDEILALDLGDRQGVRLVVERVDADTRPALDLEDLARGSDAPALLARILLGRELGPDLADGARRAAVAVASRSHYAGLGGPVGPGASDPAVAEDPVPAALRRQAARLLDALMRQKEPS